MEKTLIQGSASRSTTFTIDDTGLFVVVRNKQSETESHFPFEVINVTRSYASQQNSLILVLAIMFIAFGLISLFVELSTEKGEVFGSIVLFITAIVLFILYFRGRGKRIFLQTSDNRTITFNANDHNQDEVNEFIDQLIEQRNSYLVSRYGTLNRNLEYAPQFERLDWLLNVKAISKAEYDKKLEELNILFNGRQTNTPIGFSQTN